MISNYRDFLILESILEVSEDFSEILYSLRSSNKVAKELYSLIDFDVRTKFNCLTIGDKNDEVGFQNDIQYQRNTSDKKPKNFAKIGRLTNQILSNNGVKISDRDLEDFINRYKSIWNRKYSVMEEISLVSGEDIRYWYDQENYRSGGGQLNNSCMRSKGCQPFFDIYVNNPDVCQLLILIDGDRKLLGRALVWKIEGGEYKYYLDRIYTRFDSDVERIEDWFENYSGGYSGYNQSGFYVQLKKAKFDKYPYMDTFYYLDIDDNRLLLGEDNDSSKIQYKLLRTDGRYEVENHYFSKRLDKWILSINSTRVWNGQDWDHVPSDMAVRDWKNSNYYLKEICTWSKLYNGWVFSENAIEFEGNIVDSTDLVDAYDDIDGSPKKILVSLNGDDYRSVMLGGWSTLLKKELCIYDIGRSRYISRRLIDDSEYVKMYSVPYGDLRDVESKQLYIMNGSINLVHHSVEYKTLVSLVPYGILINDDCIMNKVNLDLFGLESNICDYVIRRVDYPSIYCHSIDKLSIEHIENTNWFKNKEAKIKEIVDISKNVSEYSYKSLNTSYNIVVEHGSIFNYVNKNTMPLVINLYEEIIKNIDDFYPYIKDYGYPSSEKLETLETFKKYISDNKKYIMAWAYFRAIHDRRYGIELTMMIPNDTFLLDVLSTYEYKYGNIRINNSVANLVQDVYNDYEKEMFELGIEYQSRKKFTIIEYWDKVYDEYVKEQ